MHPGKTVGAHGSVFQTDVRPEEWLLVLVLWLLVDVLVSLRLLPLVPPHHHSPTRDEVVAEVGVPQPVLVPVQVVREAVREEPPHYQVQLPDRGPQPRRSDIPSFVSEWFPSRPSLRQLSTLSPLSKISRKVRSTLRVPFTVGIKVPDYFTSQPALLGIPGDVRLYCKTTSTMKDLSVGKGVWKCVDRPLSALPRDDDHFTWKEWDK